MKRIILALLMLPMMFTSAFAERWVVDQNLTIDIVPDPTKKMFCLTFTLQNDGAGYVGLAYDDKLFPADTVVMWIDENSGQARVWDAFNPGIASLPSFPSPLSDTDPLRPSLMPLHSKQNYTNVEGSRADGITTLKACRPFVTGDPFDYNLINGNSLKLHAFYNMNQTWFAKYNYQQASPVSSNSSGKFIKEINF